MKKKILLTGLIIIFLSGCGSSKINDNEISAKTAKVMLEKEVGVFKEDIETEEEDILNDEPITMDILPISPDVYDNNSYNDVANSNIPAESSTALLDCIEIDVCTEKGEVMRNLFKEIIKEVKYLPVEDKEDQLLGYVINYEYQEYQFDDINECKNYGDNFLATINSDELIYECSDDGIITVKDNILGGMNDTTNN